MATDALIGSTLAAAGRFGATSEMPAMVYDSDLHDRRSTRLWAYDYARPGSYFVTLCAARRGCIFGTIVFGRLVPTVAGAMVHDAWVTLVSRHPQFALDAAVVMPNHLHAIVHIRTADGQIPEGGMAGAPARVSGTGDRSLPWLINGF